MQTVKNEHIKEFIKTIRKLNPIHPILVGFLRVMCIFASELLPTVWGPVVQWIE